MISQSSVPHPNLIPTFLDPFPPLITISLSGGAGEAGSRVCFCQRCNVKGIIKHHIVTFLDMLCYRLCGVLYAMKSSLQNILWKVSEARVIHIIEIHSVYLNVST